MRKLVGAIALLVLVAAFFLLIPEVSQNPPAEAGKNGTASLGIYSSEMADSGGKTVAVLHLFLYSNDAGNVTVFCSDRPIQQNVLVLQHATVPGLDTDLPAKIGQALSRAGFSYRASGTNDALASQNSVIIAPTGAVPSEFAGKEDWLQMSNNRLIVVGMLPGRQIDAQGNIAAYNGSGQLEEVHMAPSGASSTAQEVVERVLFLPDAKGKAVVAFGNFTVAIEVDAGRAYCRAVHEKEWGVWRFSDSGGIEKPPGTLAGPAAIAKGQQAEFEFSPLGQGEVGRTLRFFAAQWLGNRENSRKAIAGGEITEGWASKFQLGFAGAGRYTVKIFDQFERLHAAAYVDVRGLSVSPVSHDGNRYVFGITAGGEQASGAVEVWIGNGSSKEYYAANGTLVVWAAPAPGNRTMHFEFGGMGDEWEFVAEEDSFIGTYVRYGVPSLIFLAAVYFLIRAGRKAKYTVTFPQFAPPQPEILEVGPKELLDAWEEGDRKLGGHGLPAHPDEIASALCRHRRGGKINTHSLVRALRKLPSGKEFLECNGAFLPAARAGGFSPRELGMLRLMHDVMLERGIAFRRGRLNVVGKARLELMLYHGKGGVLGKIGAASRAVVFENEGEMEGFEKSLGGPDPANTRIKIALANGKLALILATRAELESALP